jgi:hypothetical protein
MPGMTFPVWPTYGTRVEERNKDKKEIGVLK